MSSLTNKVCVLTVTYGNRWQFLNQVLSRLLISDQIISVIVVNNASVYNVDNHVKKLDDERILVINNIENQGSAGGYKMALEYAIKNTDADFFWLLDDDNLPKENVIDKLLSHWAQVECLNNKKALFCLREDRIQHVRIAKGENPYRYYLVPNNFLGFNIFRVLYNQFYKLRDKVHQNRSYQKRVQVPYVPYGGLLLHRSIIKDIGYPDERLFVYVDDSEYTYRITKNGGHIWLIPECKVIDIDKSQGLNYKKKPFHSHLLDQWNFRTYYHVRNRMFFYSNNFISNSFVFKLNKTLYLFYLRIISLLSSRTTAYSKLVKAVDDGLNGRLGKADQSKF
jgi:GT2 family glycosyltransferase